MALRTIDQCGDPAGINFPQLLGGRYFRRRDILRASILCHPRIIYDLGEASMIWVKPETPARSARRAFAARYQAR